MAFDFTRGMFHVTRRGSFAHRTGFMWHMTSRGVTFVPSSAIRSAKSTVLQAQEVPQSGSFGPHRSGNRQPLHWTDMSFAWVKQRFVCFWHSKGFFGHIRLRLRSMLEDAGHIWREIEHKCRSQDRAFAVLPEKRRGFASPTMATKSTR